MPVRAVTTRHSEWFTFHCTRFRLMSSHPAAECPRQWGRRAGRMTTHRRTSWPQRLSSKESREAGNIASRTQYCTRYDAERTLRKAGCTASSIPPTTAEVRRVPQDQPRSLVRQLSWVAIFSSESYCLDLAGAGHDQSMRQREQARLAVSLPRTWPRVARLRKSTARKPAMASPTSPPPPERSRGQERTQRCPGQGHAWVR